MTTLSQTRSTHASSTTARRGGVVVAANVLALAVWALITTVLGVDLVVDPGTSSAQTVGALPVLVVTVGASLVAWGVLALLERFAGSRGTRVWQAGTVLVFLVSLFPVLAPGSTDLATRVSLALLHVLVTAVVLVGMTRPVRSH